MSDSYPIPKEVTRVTNTLRNAGFESFLVGGCVRDMLLGRKPKDWDITTNATPEEIQSCFGEDETFYENTFGTVGVKVKAEREGDEDGIVEVTPYRTEGKYSDARRPDEVRFAEKLSDDLQRRDFTVNAIAYDPHTQKFVDLYGGKDDLTRKSLRAVGVPHDRFSEDALRMLRAIRLSAELGFSIEGETMAAIAHNAPLLERISQERIRDEFSKMILSREPAMAIALAEQLGLLAYILPELREGIGVEQGKKAHAYDVFEHLLRSLQHAADKDLSLEERLAALLHDIAKPCTRRKSGMSYTFYGHEVVGARMTKTILMRMRYPKEVVDTVERLVRWHMFFSDPDIVTLSAVRRMITNVGEDHIQDLLRVRMCDRIGSGRPKEQPFRFRKYQAMVDEALRDPISVRMLKIDGTALMQELGEAPGPRIGWVLHALLEDVLDDPTKNTHEYLRIRAQELLSLQDTELRSYGERGVEKRKDAEAAEIRKIHEEHDVD